MKAWGKVNLAVSILLHEKKRLFLSILSISLAVLVVFMEQGFFHGLNDSQVMLYDNLNADLVIMNSKQKCLRKYDMMRRSSLYQTLGIDEVVEVVPVYKSFSIMRNPQTEAQYEVFCLAFPDDSRLLKTPIENEQREALKINGTVLFDSFSRRNMGKVELGEKIELDEMENMVGGFFKLGPALSFDGNILMSEPTKLKYMDEHYAEQISFGLLRVKPGTDLQALKTHIAKVVNEDVTILTPEELREREIYYNIKSTPMGAVFGMGMIIGFIIGTIICYQILYNQITDHIPQFATMRAIGFSDIYLREIILQQAILLALIGFIPGIALSKILFSVLFKYTGMPMFFTFGRVAFVLIMTFTMCIVSGLMAGKKLSTADPAELF